MAMTLTSPMIKRPKDELESPRCSMGKPKLYYVKFHAGYADNCRDLVNRIRDDIPFIHGEYISEVRVNVDGTCDAAIFVSEYMRRQSISWVLAPNQSIETLPSTIELPASHIAMADGVKNMVIKLAESSMESIEWYAISGRIIARLMYNDNLCTVLELVDYHFIPTPYATEIAPTLTDRKSTKWSEDLFEYFEPFGDARQWHILFLRTRLNHVRK